MGFHVSWGEGITQLPKAQTVHLLNGSLKPVAGSCVGLNPKSYTLPGRCACLNILILGIWGLLVAVARAVVEKESCHSLPLRAHVIARRCIQCSSRSALSGPEDSSPRPLTVAAFKLQLSQPAGPYLLDLRCRGSMQWDTPSQPTELGFRD